MENNTFYTKGDKEETVLRINQVHTITLFCPMNDYGVTTFKNACHVIIPKYRTGEDSWKGVPAIDLLNTFMVTTSLCENSGFDVNKDILSVIFGSLKMFKNLKRINLEFTYDTEVEKAYQLLLKRDKEGLKKSIYRVELIEMNLSNMFSQRIIDLLNKVFIYNGLLPNSYLERKFKIDFKFDEYMSFINMFLGNNRENIDQLDSKIFDYFSSFPPLVQDHKPNIRLLTNYSDVI